MIEKGNGDYPPLLVFPEGTTSNGTILFKFKKGAFLSEKKVRPYTMHYSNWTVHLAWENIDILPLLVFVFSWGIFSCKLQQFPDFEPNEYLFETHRDKGSTRWEIYAWAVRQIMMEHGGLKESNVPYKVKNHYFEYLNFYKGAVHPANLSESNTPGTILDSPHSLKFLKESHRFFKSKNDFCDENYK